jgi:hypothetical protein
MMVWDKLLHWRDRRPRQLLAAITCLVISGIAVVARAEPPARNLENPDGQIYTSIACHVVGAGSKLELVAIDPQSGKCKMIVADGFGPRLSPNGQFIAFCKMASRLEGNTIVQASEVWVQDIRGGAAPHQIWTGEGSATLCWAHDGMRVIVSQSVLSVEKKRWQHSTWLVDPEKAEVAPLKLPPTEGIVDCAHRSDLLISWSSRRGGIDLFTMLPDGTQSTALTTKGQYDYQGRFSLDDTKIAFLRRQRGLLSACTADVDGKNSQVAFTEKGLTYLKQIGWSPDAKRVALVLFDWTLDEKGKKVQRPDDDSHYRIAIMDCDGANYRELSLDRAADEIGSLDWR